MPTVTVNLPANGETAYVTKYNVAITAILGVLNGGIASDNLADGAATSAKIADNSVSTTKIVNKSVTAAKIEDQQAWVAPSYQNSWVDFGGTNAVGGYMKDSLGFVHLRGMVKNGTVGQAIFTLPAGYRTSSVHAFMVLSNNAVGRVEVAGDGTVKLTNGSNVSVSLDGITFKASA